jgi:hypothetical protein
MLKKSKELIDSITQNYKKRPFENKIPFIFAWKSEPQRVRPNETNY